MNSTSNQKTVGDLSWSVSTYCDGEDTLYTCHLEGGGRLTVLDRQTGFHDGRRDVETGYKDEDGLFWLASGDCDVREHKDFTIEQAIAWVKESANTCVGV